MTVSRERMLLGLTLAGLTAAFLAAVLLPGRRSEAALRAEIELAQADIARGPAVLEQLRQANQQIAAQQKYLAAARAAIPLGENPGVLGHLSRVALANRLRVVRLEPETSLPHASYVAHPYRLEFRGDFGSLMAFLRGLEQESRLFAITELRAHQAPNRTGWVDLEGSLQFAVYAGIVSPAKSSEENGSLAAR